MTRYIVFLFALISGGVLAYWLGETYLINITAQCPGLVVTALVATVILLLVVLVPVLFREGMGLEESLIGYIKILMVTVVLASILPLVVASVFSNVPAVRSLFCVDCATPDRISALLDEGKVDEAEAMARTFVNDETARIAKLPSETPAVLVEFSKGCLADGELQLARAIYTQSGASVEEFKALQVVDDASRESCEQKFSDVNILLDEAEALATKLNNKDLLSQIMERRERAQELSKKCQPEVFMKVLTTRSNDTQLTIDVQVFTGSGAKKAYKPGMAESLQVWNDATQIEGADVSVDEKGADDKVCLIFLADSSGSIRSNQLDDIRAAVDVLNDVRKRGDYFGIVTFGGRNEIQNVGLRNDALDRSVINNNGGNTAIWDATEVALNEMQANCDDSITERYIMLMTDGKDNHSRYMREQSPVERATSLRDRAVTDKVDICVIGVSEDVREDDNDAALKGLSTECGYRYVDEFSGLAAEFQEIFGYDREYYRITLNRDAINGAREVMLRVLGTDVKQPVSVP